MIFSPDHAPALSSLNGILNIEHAFEKGGAEMDEFDDIILWLIAQGLLAWPGTNGPETTDCSQSPDLKLQHP